jgi:hypothetical protein
MSPHPPRKAFGPIVLEQVESRALLSGTGLAQPHRTVNVSTLTVTAQIAPQSDPDGNGIVLTRSVTIIGRTEPGAQVRLKQTASGMHVRTTQADSQGQYQLTVPLQFGQTKFLVVASDQVGQTAKE